MVVLREKDLSEDEYFLLAMKVSRLCKRKGVLFCVNSFVETARKIPCDALQVPYSSFCRVFSKEPRFCKTGVSIHSVCEALEAERLGADFLIAGHIFATKSKKGLPPRGLAFLHEVVSNVEIPVYAIGGIHHENAASVYRAGAKGICMMSEMMKKT
jgi:thiamine-phosphate pyrophosphorylase